MWHVVLQTNRKSIPELTHVPLAINYAKTDEAKQLIEVGIHDLNAITLAYSAPPGTPKDKVQILRNAVQATLQRPGVSGRRQNSAAGSRSDDWGGVGCYHRRIQKY